jgi:putative ABC transport system permease protein
VNCDFQLTSYNLHHKDEGTDPLSKGLMKEISNIEGIKDVDFLKVHTVYAEGGNLPSHYVEKGMTKINSDLFGFDNSLLEDLKQYVTEGDLSINDLKNNNYVFIYDSRGYFQYKIGDKVKLEYIIDKDNVIVEEFIIKGKVSKNPNWLGWSNIGPTFITHEETFTREFREARIGRVNINFEKDKAGKMEKALKALVANNDEITYDSYKEVKEKNDSSFRGLKVVAYSLLGIIALIGVMNVINTMITSILSRKKEFGLLQAVGLTNKQLTKMLQIEGLYYAVISGITSIVLGTTLGYIFFQMFKKSATYAVYNLPILPIVMVAFIFVILQLSITHLVKNKLNKDSIVDRIRHNE